MAFLLNERVDSEAVLGNIIVSTNAALFRTEDIVVPNSPPIAGEYFQQIRVYQRFHRCAAAIRRLLPGISRKIAHTNLLVILSSREPSNIFIVT